MPQKPDKFFPALYGGVIMGVLSAVPAVNFVNWCCCAWILLGGFLSVYFYSKQLTAEMDALTTSDGIELGALAGLWGAIAGSILGGIIFLVAGNVAGDLMLRIMESSGALNNMPPEARDRMEQSLSQQGFPILGVVLSFVLYPLFSLLGGLIGYAVFRKRGGAKNPQQA